jgi:thiol-disulfide isomerase/thioredoxin
MKIRLIPVLAMLAFVGVAGCNTTKTDSRPAEGGATTGTNAGATDGATGEGPLARPGSNVGALTSVSPASGQTAPDFAWSAGGAERKLSDYRGRVVMINFWGTWCPPCRRELPALVKIREELGQDRFEIIGINVGERVANPAEHVAAFAKNNNINYPLVIADNNIVTAYGGIEVVPTTILVDGEGRIVERIEGSRDEAGFRAMIDRAMKN